MMRSPDPFEFDGNEGEMPESSASAQSSQTTHPKPRSASIKCSYCAKSFRTDESRFLPFCSRRCQQLDLRNWLTESYGLPFESGDGEMMPEDYDEPSDI